MELREILVESFRMLLERPRLFVPKLVSTSISTVWILGLGFSLTGSFSVSTETLYYYLASAPFMVFLGVFVSVMLAQMVHDRPFLLEGFMKTLGKWRSLTGLTLGLILAGLSLYVPLVLGYMVYLFTGSLIFPLLGALLSLLLMVFLSFSIFFLPVSIVERTGLGDSVRDAFDASRRNSREVILILLMSFLLLGAAFTMQGGLQKLGIIGFAASRLVSAVTTTYLFVVSPKMYLEEKDQGEP